MTNMVLEDAAFPTRPRPLVGTRAGSALVRKPSRFEIWAWSHVLSFQVGLTASYVALINFGIAGTIASPPSIDLTTPSWYPGYWAVALIVGAVLAAFGSISRKRVFERIETVGASILTIAVGSYAAILTWVAYGAGDPDKIAGAAGFTALAVPIIIRCMWLFSQFLRK